MDNNETESVETEFFSGRWPLFLRIQCCIGHVKNDPTSEEMKKIIKNCLENVRKFLKVCPFIEKISERDLYSSVLRETKKDSFWSEQFADDSTYNFNGIVAFKVSKTITKKNIFMLIESLWKVLKKVQNSLEEGFGLYFDFWYIDNEPGVIKKLSQEYDVASQIFYKQRFIMNRNMWDTYDEIIMMSYVMLNQDMSKEEQRQLCIDAIEQCDYKLSFFDKLKRHF